ncbi:MAG: AAA family ATPase, partial [Clostridiales bacterium]|nr:AAA family ATPase [Clostridiales bacterium]
KSEFIDKLNQNINVYDRFICITRPTRFGKSLNAIMLASYYTKNLDSKNVFDNLNIAKCESYEKHLNKHNVIYMSFNTGSNVFESYKEYKNYFIDRLTSDIKEYCPDVRPGDLLHEMLDFAYKKTGQGFIFIIDEWDYIFTNKKYTSEDRTNFSEFLTGLLKGQPYVELAYMTGVLPIAKYFSGSTINMFREYNALYDPFYESYFGFTQQEVETLCKKQDKVSLEQLQEWYNGYRTRSGERVYNPMSVYYALSDGECQNYWGDSVSSLELAGYVQNDIHNIRRDIIKMMAGQSLEVYLPKYTTESPELVSKEKILSLMVVNGYLTYHKGFVSIPNKEVMKKFETLLLNPVMGNLTKILEQSRDLLKATINMDADKVASIIDDVHNKNTSYFEYSDENSLACIISIAYIAARDKYIIKREDIGGKGRTDFTFYPLYPTDTAFIIELKTDGSSAENAIQQIKSRDYESSIDSYFGKKLAVGIVYDKDSKDKKHKAIIEEI